jgi:hypothetical protein
MRSNIQPDRSLGRVAVSMPCCSGPRPTAAIEERHLRAPSQELYEGYPGCFEEPLSNMALGSVTNVRRFTPS